MLFLEKAMSIWVDSPFCSLIAYAHEGEKRAQSTLQACSSVIMSNEAPLAKDSRVRTNQPPRRVLVEDSRKTRHTRHTRHIRPKLDILAPNSR